MSKHKLLLADDSVTIQKVVNLTFADEGIEVISVGDGNSAMEKFAEATPDLVMVDVNIPGVNGYRICEMIKQNEETRNVPVILLVGSFEPFDEDEARRVGANDYLTKPFQSIRQLVNKVTVLLNRSNGQETSPPPPVAADVQPMHVPERPESFAQVPEMEEAVPSPLGDAGMDDEMIQANQIGSLPVDDLQKYGSTGGSYENESFPDQFSSSSIGAEESEPVDPGKTQPLTTQEFNEFTNKIPTAAETFEAEKLAGGELPELSERRFSEEQNVSQEPVSYLEEQMVSEFESETPPVPEVQTFPDVYETPNLTSPEDYFAPREISEENPLEVEEIQQEKGFIIEEIPVEQDVSLEDTFEDYPVKSEPEVSPQDFYDPPETIEAEEDAFVQEISVEPAPSELFQDATDSSESEAVSEQPAVEEYLTPDEPVQDFGEEREFTTPPETESELPTDAGEQSFSEGEIGQTFETSETEPAFETAEIEPVSEFVSEPSFGQETPPTGFVQPDEADETEQFIQTFEGEPEASEPDFGEDFGEMPETVQETFGMPEPIKVVEETAPIQEPFEKREAPIRDAFTEEAEPSIGETAEEPLEIAPETTHSKVNALVSNRDKTDAVESVIISEFARQSITLSSEAVETIAARIAEKISEKIIQEMASEVVSDLADLIVEKMERKRQQE